MMKAAVFFGIICACLAAQTQSAIPSAKASEVKPPELIRQVEPDDCHPSQGSTTVTISLVIDEHGVPQKLKIVKSSGQSCDLKALQAVREWRFKPASLNGKPVPVELSVDVNFRAEE